MVYLYVTDISDLPDPLECPDVMEGLSKARRQKILGCKQKQKRMQSLGAGLLLGDILKQHGIDSETVHMDLHGKPVVDGIHFNLSHSGQLVVCAVSDEAVGCDIEFVKDVPKQVAEHSFSNMEKEHLQQCSGDAYNREFLRIWTKKESYLKMLGIGIRGHLNELEIKDCYIKEYELPEYQITVCAKEKVFSDLVWKSI